MKNITGLLHFHSVLMIIHTCTVCLCPSVINNYNYKDNFQRRTVWEVTGFSQISDLISKHRAQANKFSKKFTSRPPNFRAVVAPLAMPLAMRHW